MSPGLTGMAALIRSDAPLAHTPTDMLSRIARASLAEAIKHDRVRPIVRLANDIRCDHTTLDVLDSAGGFEDDHETQNCQCMGCGEYFVATIWKTDRESELDPMPAWKVSRYTNGGR